jgi:hypothetical protein
MSIFISLQGLTLPQDSETRLESQIREIIMTSIEKGDIQSDSNDIEGEKVICVCANTSVPGQTVGRGVTSLPSQPYPITIGIIGREDGIRCLVSDPAPYHLRIDEMLISFESAYSITWEKQLRSFNLCNGSWTLLVTRGNFHGGLNHISKIYKRCGGTDTLVFAKAKFLGVMTDMINIDFRVFWRLFGGQRLHFTWVID